MLNSFEEFIGDAFRHARRIKGLTSTELAKKANKTVASISMLESGDRVSNINNLHEMANLLDVKLSAIFIYVENELEEEKKSNGT